MKYIERKYLYVIITVICIASLGIAMSLKKTDSANPNMNTNNFMMDKDYFSEIPEKPEDFAIIQQLRGAGVIEDWSEIDERYWKQVEWMPLPEKYLEAIEDIADKPYEPRWCAGTYDDMVERIKNIEASDNNTLFMGRFWIRTAPGSTRDFGIKLIPNYPKSKELIGNKKFGTRDMMITQDPEETKEHIRIRVLKVCSDSMNCEETNTFILEPTLPKLYYDYVKEVWFEVEVDKDTPKGWYIVSLIAVAPDKKFTSDMTREHLYEKERGYVDPNFGASCGIPAFFFFVEVK